MCFLEKGAIMDIWRRISGNNLPQLFANWRYPANPDSSNKVPRFVSPANIGYNYGLRLKTVYVVSTYSMQVLVNTSTLLAKGSEL